MKIVVMTGDSQLALPIMEKLIVCPELRIVGIVRDMETDHLRLPAHKRLLSVLKYGGPPALFASLLRRFRPSPRRAPQAAQGNSAGGGIRDFAARHRIPIHVTGNIHWDDSLAFLRERDSDMGLVVGTRLLKRSVFETPRNGSINIHQGIIPDYRGTGTVFWPLYNNEKQLGISVHGVVSQVDSGALYLQKRIPLVYDYAKYGPRFEEFTRDVSHKLDELAVGAVVETLQGIAAGKLDPMPIDIRRGMRYRRPTWADRRRLRKILKARYAR